VIESTTTIPQPDASNVAHRLEPRDTDAKDIHQWVWMHHPWSSSLICYDCWTKEDRKYGWVKCKSGPHILSKCGERPVDNDGQANSTNTVAGTTQLTSTIVDDTWTTTELATTTSTLSIITSEVVTTMNVTTTLALEARKNWEKRVTFTNPWDHRRMCAVAEWENRGDAKGEVRIEKVKYEGNDSCSQELSLDPVGPAIFSSHTSTTRTGFTNIATVTSTVTEFELKGAATTSSTATTVWPPRMAVADEDDAVPHGDL